MESGKRLERKVVIWYNYMLQYGFFNKSQRRKKGVGQLLNRQKSCKYAEF